MTDRRQTARRVAVGLYVACFTVGAANHARDFLARGWRPYAFAPVALEAFWSALIVLDAATVALLVARRMRAGLALSAAIMVSDVAANTYAAYGLGYRVGGALQLQSLFLGFVLGSLPFVWPARG